MRNQTRALGAAVLAGCVGLTAPGASEAWAQSAPAVLPAIDHYNVGRSRLAIDGYDPVAYFPEGGGKATKGRERWTHTHGGLTYRFAHALNLEKFKADPNRYRPAYGGWCAWAMTTGDKADINPKTFKISSDGRLLLFYNGLLGNTKKDWGDRGAELLPKADERWRSISGEAARVAAAGNADVPVGAKNALSTALKIGDRAPVFTLPSATGERIASSTLLARGPIVVTFYRGGWCPYCNVQLKAYQDRLADFESRGARLVAISPEAPDHTLSTQEKNELGFDVLSDRGNMVAQSFGIAYTMPPELRDRYAAHLRRFNGDDTATLPLAATFVIDREGVVRYAFIEDDYKIRAEADDVVAALDAL